MTGRVTYSPEARQHLNALDDWITEKASADVAQRFVSAILDAVDGILTFPHAGRARDDVRPGMRTITVKKRTLIAYDVDETADEIVVTLPWRSGLDRSASRRLTGPAQRSANSPQEVRPRPIFANSAQRSSQRITAGQTLFIDTDRQ